MICYNCYKKFYVKRNFLSLFETKKYYICNMCRKAFPIKMKYEEIPLQTFNLVIISIFEVVYQLKFESYSYEISRICSYFIKKHPNYFFIYFDSLRLTDLSLEIFNFISEEENKPILLLCCEIKK
ncbi:MAG: hypothetical protein K2N64_03550 [Anaeroplasmataceae bacterium]|nr:hypothetical protein [Anaeroplasmataceae bacterium]